MKSWSLLFGRTASGRNGRSVSFAALLMSVLCAVFMAPAGAQQGAYFYSAGKRVPLPPRADFVGVQLAPDVSPQNFAKANTRVAGGAPNIYPKRRIVLIPAADAARVRSQRGVQRTVRVFRNGSLAPIVETDEILVRFKPGVSGNRARQLALSVGAVLGNPIGPESPNGYFLYVNANTNAIDAANALYGRSEVLWSHPNFIWPKQPRFVPNDPLFTQQWHLRNTGQGGGTIGADINAVPAWDLSLGNSITIAVIDSGIDLNHEEFRDRIVAPRDVVDDDNDPSPTGPFEEHGTAVAGLAAATGNNGQGISGTAPNARIMPIRLIAFGGTIADEADAFRHAADNGAHVINNSWGPVDNPSTPEEFAAQILPDSTRAAIDYATTVGRGGRGCVVFFASGNGNENMDGDGYASYNRVIAVGSSTFRDTRSSFSDFGNSLDLVAPGGELPNVALNAGLVTTDITGGEGYVVGNYTAVNDREPFIGTSASAPVAAGVAALVLSRDASLTYTEVRQILISTADRIDPTGGAYDANGFSTRYGYGRINAFRALQQINTFSVSGVIRLADGTPVQGVVVTAERGGTALTSATTGADGRYTIFGLPAGFVDVVPSNSTVPNRPVYVFTPERRGVYVPPDARLVNFTAQLAPKVTLLSPPPNTTVTAATYPLRATTENDAIVNRVDFERTGTPVDFNRRSLLAIPDATVTAPSVVTDRISLSNPGNLAALSVRVNISHPNVRQLTLTLITPDNRRIPLPHSVFGSTLNVTFDDVAVGPSVIAGIWRLEITDRIPGIFEPAPNGTLVSWGLTVTPWIGIGSDSAPNSQGEWAATWQVTQTPPGTYKVRAVAVAPGPIQEDVHENIIIPNPTIDLLTPPADSTISGIYSLRARAENSGSIQNVEFSQRRKAVSFVRNSTSQPNPLPLAIPDRTTVTDTITIPGGGVAERATLSLDIYHQFVGDLRISLVTPSGQVLPIYDEPTNGADRLRRSFILPSLAGQPFAGQYKLQIEDKSVPDVGRLVSWSLTFGLPWTLIGTDSTPNTTGIYSKTLDTQTLARGVYDFRAVAITARTPLEDVHENVMVDSSTLPTYTISGVVRKNNLPLSGVTITRTGGSQPNATVTTNSSGAYTLPAVPNGTYLVTPTLIGHSFTPFNQEVRVIDGEQINVNFTAVAGATIRGRVTDSSGAPLSGIEVRRTGSTQALVTDSNGIYAFIGVPAGTYTITPIREGYGFTPQSRQVRVETSNVVDVDFIGAVGFFIKGRITTSSGTPVGGVRVARSGSAFTTTNSNGEYLLSNVPNGTFYVTPTREGFTFSPPTRQITVNRAGVTGVDFIAVQGVTVSGRITTTTGTPVPGARVLREGGGTSQSVATNANGVYAFTEVLPGNHVIRPSGAGYAFTPAARGVTVVTASIGGVNFQATPDTQGPAVAVTQPTARTYGSLALANGTASDSSSGVARVTGRLYRYANGSTPAGYWAGGNTWTTTYTASANEMLATGTTTWVLNLPDLATGRYTFRATAWDNAGNRTFGTPVAFTMDRTGPQVQVQSPVAANYGTLRPSVASGTASDEESGVARVTVRLFRHASTSAPAGYWAGGNTWTATYSASANEVLATGTTTWSLSLPYLVDGNYTFRATARDRAGAVGHSPDIAFATGIARVSRTNSQQPPLILSDAAASSASDTVTLATGTVLSADSIAPARFAVSVNGRPVSVEGVISNGAGSITLTLPEGALTVGATVQVTWSGLRSAQGVTLAPGSTAVTVQ